MAFEYKPFINPYIGSISELMGKGDEAKAAALIRIGEIQARAAEQQGQAWGNAIQGLGNLASKTITDYNSPEARRQREVDKGNAILKAKALEQKQYEAQRVARGNLVPGRDELQFIPATTGSNPFDAPFRNVNFGGGSTPRVTTDETFALAQAGPNGEIIENALPNEGLRNSLSRLNAFGPTDGVLGAPPQVARPDALSRGMEGALGTTEMRRTLPTGRPDRIETYKKKAVGRYVTAGGLYDVKTAFDDLIEAGISQEVATHLAKQGLEANTIFSMADDLAEKSRKSQVAVAGSIANLALQAHAANPTSSLEDTLRSLQGPSGNRIPQDQLDQFEVAFFGKSPQEQELILRSMVQQWDAQGKGQAFAPGTIVRGEFSGNQEQVGTVPVADPSAAIQTLAIARADFAEGIRDGSIPAGTKFTDWSKTPEALPSSVQEYNFAVKNDGYKGTYLDYQREQANLRRPLTVNNAPNDDAMIVEAARNIVANPRDLTSPRIISSLRGDQRMRLFNEIKRISPDFNVGNIERQIKFMDSYENPAGQAAKNRANMNNILMHSADLSVVNQAYRRLGLRLTNTAISEIAKQGGTTWSQFMTPLQVLKEEIALYFAGGYAPKGHQQAAWEQILNDKATPSQVEQFAKDIIHVGLRRADTANEQFKSMMGYDDPNLITPEAVLAAQKLGLGNEVKKYGSGGQIGARGNAAPKTPLVVGRYKVEVVVN